MPSPFPRRALYLAAVLLVTIFSAGLRIYAAQRLDVDYDEPVYLQNAVVFANYMRAGDFKMLAWSELNYEHPPLNKILYGALLLTQRPLERLPDKDLPRLAPVGEAAAGPWNVVARYLSVFWGTLAVFALALLNPLAGFLLGVDTLSVKYTSEVYLEALPLLSSLLCILAYARWFSEIRSARVERRAVTVWLFLSAAFLGITIAGKYIYGIVAIAILIHFGIALARRQIPARFAWYMAGWAALSALAFFAFDPYLWPHPVARLEKSIAFHENFQESRLVRQYHYPFWQPFRWLSAFSAFYDLHPARAFPFNMDTLIFLLAILGLPSLLRKSPLFFCWLVVGLGFLLLWETKWPQYTLVILAPFSLSAAYGAFVTWEFARRLLAGQKGQPAASGTG
jgi:hypothetical protein